MPRSSGTHPMPALARESGELCLRSVPARRTRPSICRCRPMAERSSVVFPAPLRPTRVTTSPWCTLRETPPRTRASPYQADSPSISSMSLPQIGGDDLVVHAHLLVASLGENLALLQHGDLTGKVANDVHVVVDEHDGEALGDLLDQGDRAFDVLHTHARRRLVEQKQGRVESQG